MAKAKNWIYTDLSQDDALELELDGERYKLSQFSMVYGINEIPTAVATLAIGRDARTNENAKILDQAQSLTTMKEVKVHFHARGEFNAEEAQWPDSQVIFDGYFTGFSHKKLNGKIQVVANMIHWLVNLGFSSCLNAGLHQGSPADLITPAVLTRGSGTGKPVQLPDRIGNNEVKDLVSIDLWQAMKNLLCDLTNYSGLTLGNLVGGGSTPGSCGGPGDPEVNDRAREALSKIEGDSGDDCALGLDVSKPLPLDVGQAGNTQDLVKRTVAKYLNSATMRGYANQTFWDVLVRDYFPSFGMAIVPLIEKAAVIALTPAWQGASDQPWKTIETGDYAATEQHALLPKPMRGIGIYSGISGDTYVNVENPASLIPRLGACWTADAEEPGDGGILYMEAPRWLHNVRSEGAAAGNLSGNKEKVPIRTSTTGLESDVKRPSDPGPMRANTNIATLMEAYAQAIFVQEALRGRSAIISGKLRFDIAPGSHVKIKGSPEEFLQGVDKLAADTYAMVNKVTIVMDAEAASASTTFNLLYVRNDAENQDLRTSVPEHPLFGSNIMRGAALRKELDPDE